MGRIQILMAILVLVLTGCSKTVYVPTEASHTEVQYNDRWRVDTLERYRDRIVLQRGDTVYDTTVEYVYKAKEVHDSVYISVTDSIEVPYPVEIPVEVARKLTKWESFRLGAFGWLCAAVALCVVWLLRKPLLRILTRHYI